MTRGGVGRLAAVVTSQALWLPLPGRATVPSGGNQRAKPGLPLHACEQLGRRNSAIAWKRCGLTPVGHDAGAYGNGRWASSWHHGQWSAVARPSRGQPLGVQIHALPSAETAGSPRWPRVGHGGGLLPGGAAVERVADVLATVAAMAHTQHHVRRQLRSGHVVRVAEERRLGFARCGLVEVRVHEARVVANQRSPVARPWVRAVRARGATVSSMPRAFMRQRVGWPRSAAVRLSVSQRPVADGDERRVVGVVGVDLQVRAASTGRCLGHVRSIDGVRTRRWRCPRARGCGQVAPASSCGTWPHRPGGRGCLTTRCCGCAWHRR